MGFSSELYEKNLTMFKVKTFGNIGCPSCGNGMKGFSKEEQLLAQSEAKKEIARLAEIRETAANLAEKTYQNTTALKIVNEATQAIEVAKAKIAESHTILVEQEKNEQIAALYTEKVAAVVLAKGKKGRPAKKSL